MSSKRRDTIPLKEFQDRINGVLANPERGNQNWRLGLCAAILEALKIANNFGGWEYTEKAGEEYKIVRGELRHEVQDNTRRHYYTLVEIEEEAYRTYAQLNGRCQEEPEDPSPLENEEDLETLGLDCLDPPRPHQKYSKS